ncbi:unnamed protein product [Merluccius merluccius]
MGQLLTSGRWCPKVAEVGSSRCRWRASRGPAGAIYLHPITPIITPPSQGLAGSRAQQHQRHHPSQEIETLWAGDSDSSTN